MDIQYVASYRKRGRIRRVGLSRFHGFQEYRWFRSFSVNIAKRLSLIILTNKHYIGQGNVTRKYFRENFSGIETANV